MTRIRLLRALAWLVCALTPVAAIPASPAAANDPKGIVQQLYAAFDVGDMNKVLALIADDATWTYYGPDYSLPFGGVHHGPAGVAAFFNSVDATLTDVRAGQREFLVDGDKVTVPGWEESTVKATGGHYRVDNVHLYTVRDNKIIKFEEFINSSDVLEAFMPADAGRGRALFTGCAGCHGNGAEGRPEMHAPNLTGLGARYLVSQLRKFRSELRGNASDTYGFMMIGRASALPGDRGVRDVAAYVESLPLTRPATSMAGDVSRGKMLYEPCAACHGMQAEGNPRLDAPSLSQLDDHYLMTQIKHFAQGIRGSTASDPAGQQMIAAAKQLRTDKSIRDVIAYIRQR